MCFATVEFIRSNYIQNWLRLTDIFESLAMLLGHVKIAILSGSEKVLSQLNAIQLYLLL